MMRDPAEAVLAALADEGASGLGSEWPGRSCVSLIRALCRALGVPEPAYAPWEALGERQAGRDAIAAFGCMAAGHQGGLVATGHWEAVEPDGAHPRPGDVLSWEGVVVARNGEVYTPPKPQAQATGVCGIRGFRWIWTRAGLSPVHSPRRPSWITRPRPCL